MTPEEQVRIAIAKRLTGQTQKRLFIDLEAFAKSVTEKKDSFTLRGILGDEVIDLCVSLKRATDLCDDVARLKIDVNNVGWTDTDNYMDAIVRIKGYDGYIFRFHQADFDRINAFMESNQKIQAIKMFREKAIGRALPSLMLSKRTCDDWPFTTLNT